jgi:hypothetical protein
MLIFGRAIRVEQRTTVGEILYKQGRLSDLPIPIDPIALDALAEETWNAPANEHLRRTADESVRKHNPVEDARACTLDLLPDEWIYRPILERSLPGWQLQQVQVDTADAEVAASYVSAWADENGFGLPQEATAYVPGTPPSLDSETLKSYVLNAPFRLKKKARFARRRRRLSSLGTIGAVVARRAGRR